MIQGTLGRMITGIVVFTCSISPIYAELYEVHAVSSERIAQERERLEQELYRNKLHRYAVATASLAAVLGTGYLLFAKRSVSVEQSAAQHEASTNNDQHINAADNASTKNDKLTWHEAYEELKVGMAAIKEVQHDHGVMTKAIGHQVGITTESSTWLWSAWSFIKCASGSVMHQVAAMAVFSVINNGLGPISRVMHLLDNSAALFAQRIFHEGDLGWFMNTHVHIPAIMTSLLQHCAVVEDKTYVDRDDMISTGDAEYHTHAVYMHWNILVQQVESLLAFMEYQAKRSMDKPFVTALVNRMQSRTILLINECAQQFDAYRAEGQLFERLSELEDRINEILREYRVNEVLLG